MHAPWLTAFGAVLCGRRFARARVLRLRDWALRRLIEHAYRNVPFYRRLFDRHGVRSQDIRTAADLRLLPVTTRQDVRSAAPEDLLARGVDARRLVVTRTSGSTGQPLWIRRTWLEQRLWSAYWLRAMHALGLRASDRAATVMTLSHGRARGKEPHQRLLNAFGMYRHAWVDCCREPEDIARTLARLRPGFLGGYPGVLARVAEAMERGGPPVRPRAVWVSGESLTEPLRCRIGHAFGAPVYDLYGCHELHLLAWECPRTGLMHTCDDGVVIEVLKDGRPAGPGEQGELVGTALYSYAAPFIRYRLGDEVTVGPELCPCGEPFSTLRRVVGRTVDYFPLPDGRLLHPYRIVSPMLDSSPWVCRYQLVQQRLDRVALDVVASPRPSAEEVRRLERIGASVLGPAVEFRVRIVDHIAQNASGKYHVLRSLVALTGPAGHGQGE